MSRRDARWEPMTHRAAPTGVPADHFGKGHHFFNPVLAEIAAVAAAVDARSEMVGPSPLRKLAEVLGLGQSLPPNVVQRRWGTVVSVNSDAPSPPGAPTIATVTSMGGGQAAVVYYPPANNGGAPIDNYQVNTFDVNGALVGQPQQDAGGSPTIISGLSTSSPYTFTVQAHNGYGWGAPSAPSNPVTLGSGTGLPSAPTNLTAVAGDTQITVSIGPPQVDGGSTVDNYRVQCDNGTVLTQQSGPFVFTGLTNGSAYNFRARAHNANGWGDWSVYYGPFTPAGTVTLPGQPQGVTVTQVGTDGIEIDFVPPDPGGGTLSQIEVNVTESGIDPVIIGLLDNGGVIPPAYAGVVDAVVITCRWADLQLIQGGTLQWTTAQTIASDASGNDQYTGRSVHADIETARTGGYLAKLRILGGIWAPDWAKALGGGAVTITDPQTGNTYTVGRWWSNAFRDAYADLLAKVASLYDADPVVVDFSVNRCTTIYGESFTRQGTTNNAALIAAGFTATTDLAAIAESIDQAATAFTYTRFSLSLNPYQYIVDATHTTNGDWADTQTIAEAARAKYGTRFITGNNSFRATMLSTNGYSQMYSWLEAHQPFFAQVAQNPSIGDTVTAVNNAVALGASYVELHANEYQVIPPGASPAGLQPAATQLGTQTPVSYVTIIDGTYTYAEPLVISGLSQLLSGHTYLIKIRIANELGFSDWSAQDSYQPVVGGALPPDPPTSVVATQGADSGGKHSVSIAYVEPANNGGAAINNHNLYVTDRTTGKLVGIIRASTIGAGLANPIVFNDARLVTGDQFSFQVSAINSAGEGTPSAQSARITINQPSSAPGAPGSPTAAAAGATSANVSWTAAADNGSAIDYYVVTSSPGGLTAQTADGTTLQATVTGLTTGTAYTFTIKAHNANGLGTASAASNSVTPAVVVPQAPVIGVASILDNGGGAASIRGVPHFGTTGSSDLINSVALTKDPGTRIHDVIRIAAWQRSSTGTFTLYNSDGVTPAPGFTALTVVHGAVGDNWTQQVWERTVDGTEDTGWIVKSSVATQRIVAGAVSYVGIDNVNPDDPSPPATSGQYNTAQTNVDAGTPAATTIDGDILLGFFAVASAANSTPQTVTPPGGWTQRGAQVNTTDVSHNNVGMIVADFLQTTHGSPGDIAASVVHAQVNGGIVIPLRAAKTKALVSFTAPVDNGGAAIDLYTATSSPGGFTGTVAGPGSGQIEVDGLTPGTAYTFTVTAHNSAGTSAASAASNSVTGAAGATVPDPPTGVALTQTASTPGAHAFSLAYVNPLNNGGASITKHRAFFYDAANPAEALEVVTFTTANPYIFNDQLMQTGGTYYVVLTAINSQGESVGSTASSGIVILNNASAPSAPGTPTAIAGNAKATVSWTAAADNGSAIDYYLVTSTPGGFTAQTTDGSTLQIDVTGLTNGTAYTFKVQAHNVVGLGTASAASNSVTPAAPATVPSAPTIGTVSVTGAGTVSVPYTAPASDGGATIDKYVATSSPGGITGQVAQAGSGTITVSGLDSTGATSYTFTVQAHNSVGFSAASAASNSVTPTGGSGGVPGRVQNVSIQTGPNELIVSFDPPNAGAPFTNYEAQTDTGAVDVQGTTSPITITGLTNGTAYRVKVRAKNANGWGPWTALSSQFTPGSFTRSLNISRAWNQPGGGTFTAAQGALFDMVSMNASQSDEAQIGVLNPACLRLRYNKGSHTFSGEYNQGGWPEAMFLHSDHPGSVGTRLFTGSGGVGNPSGIACIDPNHASFISMREGNVDTDVVHGHFDGEFLDVEGPDAISSANLADGSNPSAVYRSDGRAYYDRSASAAANAASLLQWEKDMGAGGGTIGAYAVTKGGTVCGNGLVNSNSWAKTKYLYHGGFPSSGSGEQVMCMAEGFLFSGSMKNGFALPSQTFVKAEIAMIQEATDPAGINGIFVGIAKAWTNLTDAQNKQARRMAAAVILLGANGRSSAYLDYEMGGPDGHGGYTAVRDLGPSGTGYPDLVINLGDPVVSANLNDTHGVMSRVYPGGLVLLNMTGGSVTYTLPGSPWTTYTDQDGNTHAAGATITITNNTALILSGS